MAEQALHIYPDTEPFCFQQIGRWCVSYDIFTFYSPRTTKPWLQRKILQIFHPSMVRPPGSNNKYGTFRSFPSGMAAFLKKDLYSVLIGSVIWNYVPVMEKQVIPAVSWQTTCVVLIRLMAPAVSSAPYPAVVIIPTWRGKKPPVGYRSWYPVYSATV